MGIIVPEGWDPNVAILDHVPRIDMDLDARERGRQILTSCIEWGVAVTAGGEQVAELYDRVHVAGIEYDNQPPEVRGLAMGDGHSVREWGFSTAVPGKNDFTQTLLLQHAGQPIAGVDKDPVIQEYYEALEATRPVLEGDSEAFCEALCEEFELDSFPCIEDIQHNITRKPTYAELGVLNARRVARGLRMLTMEEVVNARYPVVWHEDGDLISAGAVAFSENSTLQGSALEMQVERRRRGLRRPSEKFVPVNGLKRGETFWYPGQVAAELSRRRGRILPRPLLRAAYHQVANPGFANGARRSSIVTFYSMDYGPILEDKVAFSSRSSARRLKRGAEVARLIGQNFGYVRGDA